MKNSIKYLILILAFTQVKGQDMHFTQFYANRLYMNPAFTGAGTCSRVSLTHRIQWAGIPNGFKTTVFSYDHYLHKEKMGLGLLVANDVAGSGGLKRTIINPLVAYETKINRKMVLRYGIEPSIGLISVDYNKLLFGDQIARGGATTTVPTLETPYQNLFYFDVGAGILLYSRDFWAGFAFSNLMQPTEGLIAPQQDDILPRKFSFHGGYKLVTQESKTPENEQSLTFAMNYRGQQNFDQLDLGTYFAQGYFTVGVWYRGLPGIKAYQPGYGNSDAIGIVLGVQTQRFNFGYSYDFTVSKLTNASQGAHEITISHSFCDPNKVRKTPFPVVCPKF